jgi:hypothetical protein
MPEEKKIKFALRMKPQTQGLVKDICARDSCLSQSECIERAIRFYHGYITAKDASEFLTRTLSAAIRGTMDDSEGRIARLLFKLAVEVSMMMNVLASGLEISDEELSRLRGKCVGDVKRTSGRITFEDAVKFQKGE